MSVRNSINVLSRYSLIKREQAKNEFSIHPIVHLWIQERLSVKARAQSSREVLVVLHRAFQEFGLGDDSHGFRLARHLTAVLHNVWRYRYELDETAVNSIVMKLRAPLGFGQIVGTPKHFSVVTSFIFGLTPRSRKSIYRDFNEFTGTPNLALMTGAYYTTLPTYTDIMTCGRTH